MHPRWIFAAGLAAVTTRAAAQETPAEVARRELIAQAESASDAGDHARALELAARAAQTRMTPSLGLLLAQEQHALGRTLEALDAAGRCARDAQGDAALRNRERILASCEALAATLRRRVGRLTVRLAVPTQRAQVVVAGRALDAALVGVPYPVLPGRVAVVAEADGYATFRRELELAAGAEETVVITLAPTAAAPRAGVSVTVAPRSPGVGPWILAGAGALSLGAGVLFWRFQEGSIAAREASRAQWEAQEHHESARTWNLATNIAYGVGAAAVVGGVVWWLVARPSREDRRSAWSVGAAPVADGVVVTAGGRM